MNLIILFDIDGTLISTGGAGRRAIQAGLREVVGRPITPGFSFAGMTDRAIMRRALVEAGQPVDEGRIDAVLQAYLKELPRQVEEAPDFEVFSGVSPLLKRLDGRDDLVVGLGTGNARRGAEIKLGRAGLNRYFRFGGFGCEFECRKELIGEGIKRGARLMGRPVSNCRVVVVGDTPADIEAAHHNGADALAVTTGSWERSRLEDYRPRWLVDSLNDEVVRSVIGC